MNGAFSINANGTRIIDMITELIRAILFNKLEFLKLYHIVILNLLSPCGMFFMSRHVAGIIVLNIPSIIVLNTKIIKSVISSNLRPRKILNMVSNLIMIVYFL